LLPGGHIERHAAHQTLPRLPCQAETNDECFGPVVLTGHRGERWILARDCVCEQIPIGSTFHASIAAKRSDDATAVSVVLSDG